MPRRVDQQERRERIAAAVLRVAASRGLEGISLRHVAAEVGATTGLVQHYFPSKEAIVECAMRAASAGFEARMTTAIESLGPDPAAREVVRAVLITLLPVDDEGRADGLVALAFMAYASTRPPVAERLEAGATVLRSFLAEQLRAAIAGGEVPGTIDPHQMATALLAVAEGLSVQTLSNNLPAPAALAALDAQLDLVFHELR